MATTRTKSVKTEIETVKETKKKTFGDFDYILCRSVWAGGLNITCPSGSTYEFRDYGAECEIAYRDLVNLIRLNSEHIFLPRFIICDEDFLKDFPQVAKMYAGMYSMEDLLTIVDLPVAQMTIEINKLPEAAKSTLASLIASEISSGRIDSVRKIRALTEIFGFDFNLLSELFRD